MNNQDSKRNTFLLQIFQDSDGKVCGRFTSTNGCDRISLLEFSKVEQKVREMSCNTVVQRSVLTQLVVIFWHHLVWNLKISFNEFIYLPPRILRRIWSNCPIWRVVFVLEVLLQLLLCYWEKLKFDRCRILHLFPEYLWFVVNRWNCSGKKRNNE